VKKRSIAFLEEEPDQEDNDKDDKSYGSDDEEDVAVVKSDEEEEEEEEENSSSSEEDDVVVVDDGSEKEWHSCPYQGVSKQDFIDYIAHVPRTPEERDLLAPQVRALKQHGAAIPKKRSTRPRSLITDRAKIIQLFLSLEDTEPFEQYMQRHYFGVDALTNHGNRNSTNFKIQQQALVAAAKCGVFRLTGYKSPIDGDKFECFLCKSTKFCGHKIMIAEDSKVIGNVGGECAARFNVLQAAGAVYRRAVQYQAMLEEKPEGAVDWEVDDLLKMLAKLDERKANLLSGKN
jgi:hypothetical protein